jgi:hypothetical protein
VCPGMYHNFENAAKFQCLVMTVTNKIYLKMKLYKQFFSTFVKLGFQPKSKLENRVLGRILGLKEDTEVA